MLLFPITNKHAYNMYKSSSGDEIPERDVSPYMITYLSLNYDTAILPEYFLSNAYLLYI